MTYQTLDHMLTGRNKDSRKLANNTYLIRKDNGNIAVRLHDTDVVTYHPNGNIIFNSGGYRTLTTKARMNEFSDALVSQKNGHWSIRMTNKTDWVNYADGITWEASSQSWCGMGEDEKSTTQLAKQAKKFAHEYMKAFDAGEVSAPGAGDCWGCLFVDEDGKTAMGSDHIFGHIKEKYFVPSLLARAIERFPVSQAAKWYLSDKWAGTSNGDFARGIGYPQLEKSLYRYIKEQTGVAA